MINCIFKPFAIIMLKHCHIQDEYGIKSFKNDYYNIIVDLNNRQQIQVICLLYLVTNFGAICNQNIYKLSHLRWLWY
jgi:hypothetical protein